MKKLMTMLCAVLACSFLFTATPVQAKTANYEMVLTKNYQRFWSNGTNTLYIKDVVKKDVIQKQKLYLKNVKSGKVTLLKTLIPNREEEESYSICNVYGTTVYMNKVRGVGDGDLYSYNWKTKKWKCLGKQFVVMNASGKWMITSDHFPTDPSPYTSYIYKITGKGLEKVLKLGTYTSQTQFSKADGRIYYAKYGKGADMHKMSVYSCKADGTEYSKITTVVTNDKNDTIILQDVTKDAITYVVQNEDQQYYHYDRNTKETTKIPDPYEQ